MKPPILIAHQGDTVNFHENTLEAFQSAFEKGANGVELDIHYHNNELIVVHNYLFDKHKRYLKLSEVLALFSKKGRIEIEVKSMELGFLIPLKKLLKTYKHADIEITTSIFPLVNYIYSELSDYPLGIIFHEKDFENWMTDNFKREKIIKIMKLCKAQRVHIPNKEATESLVKECHLNKYMVHSHIYLQPREKQVDLYHDFMKLEVDQCTFDDIALLEYLKER